MCVWDLTTGATIHVLTGHDEPVAAVAISADGSRAASIGKDGQLIFWDVTNGWQLWEFFAHWIYGLTSDGSLLLYDVAGRFLIADSLTRRVSEIARKPSAVAVLPTANEVLTSDARGRLTWWNPKTGQARREIDTG